MPFFVQGPPMGYGQNYSCDGIHLASSPPDRTMLLQPGASNEVP